MAAADRVLIVEDEWFVRESMADVLRSEGFDARVAESVDEALDLLARERMAAVLTDLRMPGRDGLDLLQAGAESRVPMVMITGHGTIEDAVAAMKAGAYDFVQKPVDPQQLLLVVRRAIEHGKLVHEVARLRQAVDREGGVRTLAGSSPAMVRLRRLVEQVAPTEATVLVTGESGTGKELVVRELHRRSARAEEPLVLVNCAAVPESLFESEFFGHRRGAFSGAHADRTGRFAEAEGGTLVLDEIETLGLDVQAKLLRVLESGEYQMVGDSRTRVVDVRVLAVTNEELEARVEGGEFRRDLYYRLNVFPIELPALREHLEDVAEIAEELFARIRPRLGPGDASLSLAEDAVTVLASYGWPGNVRELRNVLERAAILAGPGGAIDAELLRGILGGRSVARTARTDLNLKARAEALEKELVQTALARAGNSKKDAAALLGVDPKNLSYYIKKHDLRDGSG